MAKKKHYSSQKHHSDNSQTSSTNKTLIYGIHAVDTAVRNTPENIQQIWVDTNSRNQRLQRLLTNIPNDVTAHTATADELTARAKSDRHQGIIAQYENVTSYNSDDLFKLINELGTPAFLLILDGITDPHNLGACLRSAECAGVHAVIAPKDNSASLTPTARKVASGAAETIPFIQVTNLNRTLKQLKQEGVWLIGTSDKASQNIHSVDLNGSLALVMGAEGKGLRRLTEESCDVMAAIPMFGKVSSLNISVATGVCLFEAVRQRASSM